MYDISLSLARQPGEIEVLSDLLLKDFKNFPQVRELGESSARFIRQEMEKMWGESHLSVLSEEEVQNWLLGVGIIVNVFFLDFNQYSNTSLVLLAQMVT